MRPFLRPAVSAIFCVIATFAGISPLLAATDYYSTGPGAGAPDTLCDVWQGLYNGWGLAAAGDEDFDGATNFVESVAGTDPRNPNDVIKVGNTTIAGSTVTFTFDAEKGKKYRILSDSVSPTGAFATVETHLSPVNGATQLIPSVGNPTQTITITKSGTSKFYRIETTDTDSDGDGVSDWAEGQLGMNPLVASSTGNGASDGDTLHSLLSLTVESTVNGYEKEDKTAGTPVPTPGKLRLVRSYGTMALNGIGMTGSSGATDATKANASAGDYTLGTINIPAGAGVPGNPYEASAVTPVQDSADEVPEAVKVTLDLPGLSNLPGPSGTLTIGDANPANAENIQLYVAYLGHEAGAATTATGYATALVNGDNTSASIAVVFNNLSSTQNTAYIREGTTNDLAPALPTGQVSGFTYDIEYKPGHYSTDQGFLNALVAGQIGCAISSANFSDKEIFGLFSKATGSITFDINAPSLVAPETGSSGFQTATEEQIERDIWRFMSQCTWGGTTAMYTQIRAKVDTRINALGVGPTAAQITSAYLQGLTDWLDDQMNTSLTPTVNFQTLVMAADNEDFMLRGNKPITYNADPQINGPRYTVTYDAAGNPSFGTTADNNTAGNNYPIDGPNRRREWWGMILQSKDQVRQRFTQALSEILIISETDQTCATRHYGTANFWDMLAAGAFGKYRNLLSQVTYSPMMGYYLSSFNNRMTYDAGGGLIVSPDENYAREIMQLFSIGLILRHPDGSLELDTSGLPKATYDQTDITELARVMTGFTHGAQHATSYYSSFSTTSLLFNPSSSTRTSGLILFNGSSATNTWFGPQAGHLYWPAPWVYPMKAIGRIGSTQYHDFGAKTLLAGKSGEAVIPLQNITSLTDAQTHAAADADLALAHNCLAGDPTSNTAYNGHQNTPVNVSRWLIQRLITSNPSAGYIYRVQKRYRDTNGNLGEVLKAIVLDYEARSLQLTDSSISHGKVKEPLVAFAATLRAFRAFSGAPMSILAQNTGFTDGDSPLPNGYPAAELAKYSTDNASPPSLPAGWAGGPFRYRFNDLTGALGQSPQRAPSVFNWFLPDYILPGPMAEAGLFAPELQINTEASVVAKVNTHYNFTWSNLVGMNAQPGSDSNISDFLLNNNFATPAVRFSLDGGITFINSLTFSAANWNVPQTLTVVAANTALKLSSLENSRLRFAVSGAGSGFDSIATTPVDIGFTDNAVPNEGLLALHSSFSTWVQEGGNTDTVTCRLQSPPPAGSTVTVNVASTSSEVSATPSSLNFDSTNWNTDQTVTVTAVVDGASEVSGSANDTLTFTSSSSVGAWNSLSTSLPVSVIENNTAVVADPNADYGIVIAESSGGTAVDEATGNDTYTVKLTKQPTASVTVTITGTAGIYIGPSGTSTTGSLTFTTGNYGTAQTVTVRANNDATAEGSYPANPAHYSSITHTASGGGYNSVQAQTLRVAITDNDNRVIMTHMGNNETRLVEGATSGTGVDTIQVALRVAPTGGANVIVNLGSSSVICEPANLTFTPANFSAPQTVNVRAADDALSQGLRRAWYPNVLPATAAATGVHTSGVITSINITNPGAGYLTPPNVTFAAAPGGGTTATGFCTLNATGGIASIVIANPGSGYTANPAISFSVVPPNVTTSKIIASATSEGIVDTGYNNVWSATHTGLDVTIIDNDLAAVSITPSGGSTTVVEGGASDDFTVALTQQPKSDVTVTLTPSAQATCSLTTLTFTPANWSTGQNVTVTAVNDTTVEGDALTTIGVLVTSADSAYRGLKASPVGVTVLDNDLVPLTIAHTNVFTGVSEAGTVGTGGTPNVSDTFTVALPKTPTANVTVTLLPDAQVTVAPPSLTFTPTNSTTTQTVTVTAVDDGTSEATPHHGLIRFAVGSTDPFYNNPAHLPVIVPIKDNDAPGFSIVESSGNTTPTEGGTDSYTVVLNKLPASNVIIDVASLNTADLTVSPAALTFTTANWSTAQTVTVTAVGDMVTEGREMVGTTHTVRTTGSDPAFTGLPVQTVNNFITDNHRRNEGIVVIATGGSIRSGDTTQTGGTNWIAEGQPETDQVSIYLSNQPQRDVILTASANSQMGFDKNILTFTPSNWRTPQVVSVFPVDDIIDDKTAVTNIQQTLTFTASGDPMFNGTTGTATFNILDNESPAVIVKQSGGTTNTTEAGATDTYTIQLSKAPNGNVVLTPTPASGTSVLPTSVTFNAANWSVPQTITVTATNDTTLEGNHQVAIDLVLNTVSTTDTTGYATPVTGVSTNSGSSALFVGATTGLTVGMHLTGTNIPVNTIITAINSSTSVTMSNNASATGSSLTLYGTAGLQRIINNITDNDLRLVVTPSGIDTRVSEDSTQATGDTYTVEIARGTAAANPTQNVVVTVAVPANQGLVASPTTLTFTPGNFSIPQTVTLSAADNGLDAERARTVTISHSAASTDANYVVATNALYSVGVAMLANDSRPRLLLLSNPTAHENGNTSTYTAALNRPPAVDLNVAIGPDAQTEFALPFTAPAVATYASTGSLTFTPANWYTFQTVTVRAIDDAVMEQNINTGSGFLHLGYTDYTLSSSGASGFELPGVGLTNVGLTATPTASATATCASTAGLQIGMRLTGTGVASDAEVASITNGTTFVMNRVATANVTAGTLSAATPAARQITTITDNETPAVRILPSGGSTQLAEGGATDTYDVVLNTAPTSNVTIGITTDAQVTADKASLTFTSGDWSTPQTVTLTAANDGIAENNHSGVVTHAHAVSTDANFTSLPVPALTAAITDNDGAQLTVTQSGGNTSVVAGGAHDTITLALNQAPTANVTVTLVPPMYIVPVPPHAKNWGYYTTDLTGSNQQKERVVLDYTEWNLLYRTTFYASLATAYGGSGNIPPQPSEVSVENAHWEATKALVDKGDLWFAGGALKARHPTLIEPNQALPVPLPALNARQALMDCIYNLSGGNANLSTSRYLPQVAFDPKNPPAGTFHDEIRDRCRWTGYLMSTVMSGYVSH